MGGRSQKYCTHAQSTYAMQNVRGLFIAYSNLKLLFLRGGEAWVWQSDSMNEDDKAVRNLSPRGTSNKVHVLILANARLFHDRLQRLT